jgi:hypothetical protein
MVLTAHGEATIKSLNTLAARYAVLAAKREIEEISVPRAATDQRQSEVEKLAALAKKAAADELDPVEALADTIRRIAQSEADPYLVLGVLIEGAVVTLRSTIPAERHQDCAFALIKMLIDRLQDNGISVSHGH